MIVGIDVGGTTTRAVAFDAALAPVATVTAPTGRGLAAISDQLAVLAGQVADPVERLAVGIPGRVDAARGVVAGAVNLGIDEPAPLAALLSDRLGVPVHVENDVSAAALGTFAHLALPPGASLAYVNVGTGIAAGFVIAGRLWRGVTGGAGEIGHIPMRPDGPLCPCGQRGCAEAVGSGRAVGRDRTRLGDVIAATAWAVQLCAMTLDVDVVAVGGGMTNGGSAFLDALRAAVAERAAASPVVAATGLAERLVLAPEDVPVGSLGAVLAAIEREPVT